MSSGKITRFQNNVRVDGDLDLSNSTGRLTLSSLSSAPSTPAVGDAYYDTVLRKARIYQDSGWSGVDGTAAGSLDAAYNGGATITVDGGAVTLTDSQTTTGGGFLITKSGVVTGANSASVLHINSTGAHDTSGTLKMFEISVGTETVGTPIGMEVEMNANGDSALTVTKGAVTLSDGALTLTSGALSVTGAVTLVGNTAITGTFSASGTSTLAAISNSGTITSEGKMIIDITNAEALLIRTNGDAADVLTIDTTGDAGDTTMLLTPVNTTGVGLHVNGSTITTGDALKVTVAAATMTAAGAAISVVADGTEVFAVRDDGSIYSRATAEGTTAFQVVTGDVIVSDGDFTVSGGESSFTDGITTAGAGFAVTSTATTAGVAVGEAGAVVITANSLTTGTALVVRADAITTGDMLFLDAGGATMTAASGFFINCNDDNASKFTVSSDGRVLISGTDATSALAITAGNIALTNGGIAMTETAANQLVISYDGSNSFGVDVDLDGSTTLTTTGTNADFEIVSGTAGDITLTAAGDIVLAATGADVNSNAPLNITVAGGSQLELIASGSIKLVDSVTDTTGVTTRTVSGGTTNSYETVADVIILDSAGALTLESTGVTSDAGIVVTKTSGNLFQAKYDANNHLAATVSIAGLATLTTTGTAASFEIATGTAGDITLDATGDIVLEAAGADITADAQLTITTAVNESAFVIVNNTITTTGPLMDISSTSISTASMLKLNANTAANDGTVLEIVSAGDTTSTPTGMSVTIASPTTGAATGIAVTMAAATTTAKGIAVTMDLLTEGNMLYLDAGGSSLTTGFYINCNDDGVSDFTVGNFGKTIILGQASGTDALTLTLGDILVSAGHVDMTVGDLTLADGSVNITDADNVVSLALINNTITSANVAEVTSSSITSGSMLKLNANQANNAGKVLEIISAGGAALTPTGIDVTIASVTTGISTGINVTMVGATTQAKGIAVTMDALSTGSMLYLDNGGATLTSGYFINCNDDTVTKFGVGLNGTTTIAGTAGGTAALTVSLGDLVITDSDANTISSVNGTATLLTLDNAGGAVAASAAVLKVDAGGAVDAAGYGILATFTGAAAAGATVIGVIPDAGSVGIKVAGGGVATAEGLYIDCDPTATSAAYIHSDAVLAADKAVLELHADTGESNADSAVLRIHQANLTGASFGATIVQADLDVGFINFEGTTSADAASPISSHGTAGATTDFIRIGLNGAKAWIAVSTNDPSA